MIARFRVWLKLMARMARFSSEGGLGCVEGAGQNSRPLTRELVLVTVRTGSG